MNDEPTSSLEHVNGDTPAAPDLALMGSWFAEPATEHDRADNTDTGAEHDPDGDLGDDDTEDELEAGNPIHVFDEAAATVVYRLGQWVPARTAAIKVGELADWMELQPTAFIAPATGAHPIPRDLDPRVTRPHPRALDLPFWWLPAHVRGRRANEVPFDRDGDERFAARIHAEMVARGMYDEDTGVWLSVFEYLGRDDALGGGTLDPDLVDSDHTILAAWVDGEPEPALDQFELGEPERPSQQIADEIDAAWPELFEVLETQRVNWTHVLGEALAWMQRDLWSDGTRELAGQAITVAWLAVTGAPPDDSVDLAELVDMYADGGELAGPLLSEVRNAAKTSLDFQAGGL